MSNLKPKDFQSVLAKEVVQNEEMQFISLAEKQELKDIKNTHYTKKEVDALISNVEAVDPNSHTHNNMTTVNRLGDSAGMLTYNGKVVVNNSEYSFKTLPRRKAPESSTYINSVQGGKLPWLT